MAESVWMYVRRRSAVMPLSSIFETMLATSCAGAQARG